MLTHRLPSGADIHLWTWNQASAHGILSQRFTWEKKKKEKKQFWREKPRLQFFGTQVVLFTWTALNLRPPATDSAALQYSKLWKKWLRPVWQHKKNILLQHDSLRPHTAMQAIEQSDLAISPHLLYSPHLVPCNVHLFFFQKWRKDCQDLDQETNVEFCDDRFEKLVCWWGKCVENSGDDVERWIQVIIGEVCGEWWWWCGEVNAGDNRGSVWRMVVMMWGGEYRW